MLIHTIQYAHCSIIENVSLLGSDDCTTCTMVVIRHTGTLAVIYRYLIPVQL